MLSSCGLPNKCGLLSNWGFCAKASWNDCWADVVVGIPFKFSCKLGTWVEGIPGKVGSKLGIWGIWGNPGSWAGKQNWWPCIVNSR